jgi:hypothetical protein
MPGHGGAFDAFNSGTYRLKGVAFQRMRTIAAISSVSAFVASQN